MLREITYLLM